MGLRDSLKGIGQGVVNAGRYVMSEFITNKDTSRGIKDFDKRQEYNKQLNSTYIEPDDQAAIYQKMAADDIIDPILYSKFMKSQQNSLKQSDSKVDSAVGEFRDNLAQDLKDNYAQGDDYQREVIEKAIEKLTTQYQYTADNVMTTYNEFKDEKLLQKWNELKPEYEQLIRDSAKKYANYINQGLTFNQAYDKIIREGDDNTNKIVKIQNQLRRRQDRGSGVVGAFKQSGEELSQGNVGKGILDAGLGILNIVSGALNFVGEGVEEGKQAAFGMYDNLEELNNLNVYKDSIPIVNGLRTLKSRGLSVIDALPQLAPSIASLFLGNKLATVGKLDETMSAILKGSKLVSTTEISFGGKFLSEAIQDLMWMDAAAQPLIGRPMTKDDFLTNWMFNLPIDAGVAAIAKSSAFLKPLAGRQLSTEMLSDSYMKVLQNTALTPEEKARYLWHEKQIVENNAGKVAQVMIDNDGTKSVKELYKELLPTNSAKELDDISLQEHAKVIESMRQFNDSIKTGKVKFEDRIFLDTLERAKKSDGANIIGTLKNPIDYGEAVIEQNKALTKMIADQDEVTTEVKLKHSTLLNIAHENLIPTETLTTIIRNASTGNTLGDTYLKAMWLNDEVAINKLLQETNPSTKINKISEIIGDKQNILIDAINDAYDRVIKEIIPNVQQYNIPTNTIIGRYAYLGNGMFSDIFTNADITLDTLTKNVNRVLPTKGIYEDELKKIISNFDAYKLEDGKYDITSLVRTQSTEYNNVWLRIENYPKLRKIFGAFNISIIGEGPNMKVISYKPGIERLQSALKSMEEKNWNVKTFTKDELSAYKISYYQQYMYAYRASGMKENFQTRFESVFEKTAEGYKISTANGTEAKHLQGLHQAYEDLDFDRLEQISATIKAEDAFINTLKLKELKESDISNLTLQDTIKELLVHYPEDEYKGLADTLISITNDVYTTNTLDTALGYAKVIGMILGDVKTNTYIKNVIGANNSADFYKSLVGRLIYNDPKFSLEYINGIVDKYTNESLEAIVNIPDYQKFIGRIEKLRDVIQQNKGFNKELKTAIKYDYVDVVSRYIDGAKHRDNFVGYKKYYVKTKNAQKPITQTTLENMSDSDIKMMADNVAFRSCEKTGLKLLDIHTKISNGINGFINFIKNEFAGNKIYVNTIGDDISIIKNEDGIDISIGSLGDMFITKMFTDDNFFEIVNHHEAFHVKQSLRQSKGLLGKIDDMIGSIKKLLSLEGDEWINRVTSYTLSANKQIDINEQLINNVLVSANKLLDKGLSPSDTIEELKQLAGQFKNDIGSLTWVEEILAEHIALAKTYGWTASQESLIPTQTLLEKYKLLLNRFKGYINDGATLTNKSFEGILSASVPTPKAMKSNKFDEINKAGSMLMSDIGNSQTSQQIYKSIMGIDDKIYKDTEKEFATVYDNIKGYAAIPTTISLGGIIKAYSKGVGGLGYSVGKAIRNIIGDTNNMFDVDKFYIYKSTYQNRMKLMGTTTYATQELEQSVKQVLGSLIEQVKNGEDAVKIYTDAPELLKKPFLYEMFKIKGIVNTTRIFGIEEIVRHLPPLDNYIMNKMVANILTEKGIYNKANIDYINNFIRPDAAGQVISGIKDFNSPHFVRVFNKVVQLYKDLGGEGDLSLKGLRKQEKERIANMLYSYFLGRYKFGDELDTGAGHKKIYALVKEFNTIAKEETNIFEGTLKTESGEDLFSLTTRGEGVGSFSIMNILDVDELHNTLFDYYMHIADDYLFTYNPDILLEKGLAKLSGLSTNLALLVRGTIDEGNSEALQHIPLAKQLTNTIDLPPYLYIKYEGLDKAIKEGIVKDAKVFIGDVEYDLVKKVNPIKLYNDILDIQITKGVDKESKITIDIDGDIKQIGYYNLWDSPVGKYIMDELEIKQPELGLTDTGETFITGIQKQTINQLILDKLQKEVDLGIESIISVDNVKWIDDQIALKKVKVNKKISEMMDNNILTKDEAIKLREAEYKKIINRGDTTLSKYKQNIDTESLQKLTRKALSGMTQKVISGDSGKLYNKLRKVLGMDSEISWKEKIFSRPIYTLTEVDGQKQLAPIEGRIMGIQPRISEVTDVDTIDEAIVSEGISKAFYTEDNTLSDVLQRYTPNTVDSFEIVKKPNLDAKTYPARIKDNSGITYDGVIRLGKDRNYFIPMKKADIEEELKKLQDIDLTPEHEIKQFYDDAIEIDIDETTKKVNTFLDCIGY